MSEYLEKKHGQTHTKVIGVYLNILLLVTLQKCRYNKTTTHMLSVLLGSDLALIIMSCALTLQWNVCQFM